VRQTNAARRVRARRIGSRSPAVSAASGDKRVREALAGELLGTCMSILKTYGVRAEKLAALAAGAAAGNFSQANAVTAVLAEAQSLSDVMNKWVEDPEYRDLTGRPAILSIQKDSGCSFGALAQEFFPNWSVADVVTFGNKANVLERVGRRKVALLNSTVLFSGNSSLILAHSVRSVRRLLRTGEFNRRAKSAALESWPDRTSLVEVAAEDFEEFVKFVRPQISGWIEMSNRWLFQRSQLSKNRLRKKRVAGLQVFVFRD
jgi:hypothetical protein